MAQGMRVLTGGTDNHLMLIDVTTFGLNGRQAESAVTECGITLNRNSIPFDPNGPWFTSGLRLGTAAVTTLGMGVEEMKEIASKLSQDFPFIRVDFFDTPDKLYLAELTFYPGGGLTQYYTVEFNKLMGDMFELKRK